MNLKMILFLIVALFYVETTGAVDGAVSKNNEKNVASEIALGSTNNVYLNNKYVATSKKLPWSDAEAECVALGGHLSSLHSAEELNFILTVKNEHLLWLGSNNDLASWTDGTDTSYQPWQPGEPSRADERCVILHNNHKKLHDLECTIQLYGICKIPFAHSYTWSTHANKFLGHYANGHSQRYNLEAAKAKCISGEYPECTGVTCSNSSCTLRKGLDGLHYSGSETSYMPHEACSVNNGGCDLNADCTESSGQVECACKPGYTGDGTTCTTCGTKKSNDVFYGSQLLGQWKSDTRRMSTYIEVPHEVIIKSIKWNKAAENTLAYSETSAGSWTVEADQCEVKYILDVDQAVFFGKGSNFKITGNEMKTYLTVEAEQGMDEVVDSIHYPYTRTLTNAVPVLVNLETTTTIDVRFTVDADTTREKTEFALFKSAVDNYAADGGNVEITMETHSRNCIDTTKSVAETNIKNGVTLQAGADSIKEGTTSTFTWSNKEELSSNDMCVQQLTWSFTPKEITSGTTRFQMTLLFYERSTTHTWSTVADIRIQIADVLGSVGFSGGIQLYKERELTTTSDVFHVGDEFFAKITLSDLVVPPKTITCTQFQITQTVDGQPKPTDMMQSKYNFDQFDPDATSSDTWVCHAELQDPEFRKSQHGHDTLLQVIIEITYEQGFQYGNDLRRVRRILNVPISKGKSIPSEANGLKQLSHGQAINYREQTREPECKEMEVGFTIAEDLEAKKVVQSMNVFEREGKETSSNIWNNALLLALGFSLVVMMVSYGMLYKKSKAMEYTPLVEEEL
jgi:hypothetical protein